MDYLAQIGFEFVLDLPDLWIPSFLVAVVGASVCKIASPGITTMQVSYLLCLVLGRPAILKNALVACLYWLTPIQVLAGIAAKPVLIRLALRMIISALCTISLLVLLFSVPMLAHSIA